MAIATAVAATVLVAAEGSHAQDQPTRSRIGILAPASTRLPQ
jgi:hypothetical protein